MAAIGWYRFSVCKHVICGILCASECKLAATNDFVIANYVYAGLFLTIFRWKNLFTKI